MGRKLTEQEKKLVSVSTYNDFETILNDMFISPRQKKIAMLYYFEKKTFLEIGEELFISEKTVSLEIRDFAKKLASYIDSSNQNS